MFCRTSKKTTALLGGLGLLTGVSADDFHCATYYNDYFTSFSGTMVVPSGTPSGGTPYMWPGLQPGDSGVLQNVLDGRSDHYYYGNTWVGSPSEPYGGGFSASNNENLGFAMVETPVGSGNWTITSTGNSGAYASYQFDVQHRMTEALFCVELYSTDWNFGDLVFTDVTVVGEGSNSGWCTSSPQYSDVTPTFSGVTASVASGYVTCHIDKVTLAPASGS